MTQDKNKILLDMTKDVEKIELGSVCEDDLMFIRCFATTEGKNLNGTYFSRRLLANSYSTFLDKPLVIVPSYLGEPTGHGYDFINKRFKNNERKVVGHVIDSKLVIVPEPSTSSSKNEHEDEDLIVLSPEDISSGKYLVYKGELRILCTVVVYQHYLTEVADVIRNLHDQNRLNFSMEGLMDATEGDDGVKYADDITFTGLAIVKNPAFVNSYSLEVAEILDNKGGVVMAESNKNQNQNQNQNNKDNSGATVTKEKYGALLQKYNDLLEKYNALKEQKSGGSSNSGSDSKSQDTKASVDMANKYTEALEEIAELKSQIKELTPFKERIETAEKLQVGKDRLERLSKLSKVDVTAEQLAEMSEAEYIEMLEKAVDAKKPATETAEEIDGVIFDHSAGGKSNKSILLDAIAELTKDE